VNLQSFRRRVGENIKRARWRRSLTQEAVASRTCSLKTFAELERGRGNPTLETLFTIARVLHTTPASLIEMDPEATRADFQAFSALEEAPIKRGRKAKKGTPSR